MNATRCYAALAAVAAALALAACGGGSSSPVAPIAVKPSAVPILSTSTSQVAYGANLLAGATFVQRASLGSVGANVVMNMRDAAGLLAYAKASNDPKNALYRHWLTPAELGDRFGVDANDYATTAKYLVANGIEVKTYPQRQVLRVLGSQANVERALGVQFGVFKKSGKSFVAPMSAPRPSVSLKVAGLSNVVHLVTKSRRLLSLRATNSFIDGFSPQQIANGFDFTGAYAAGYKGDGITIGIIGTGPIADGDSRVNGGDVAEFRKIYGVAGTGTVTQDVDLMNVSPGNPGVEGEQYSSGLASPPPVTSPTSTGCVNQGYDPAQGAPSPGNDYTTCNPEDLEAQLDTEQAATLAPDANVNFYIAYNPDECFGSCADPNNPNQTNGVGDQEIGLDISDDEIQQAIGDSKSDVIAMSFGEGEDLARDSGYFGNGTDPTQGYGPVEIASLVSEGTAVFVSSGDNGAEECSEGANVDTPCTAYPATDPSAVSVGGVNAPLDNSGRLTGPMTGWGEATQYFDEELPGGSGGGCSTVFSKPAFETGITSVPCGSFRAQPDVALDADTDSGVSVVIDAAPGLGGREIFNVGGTSVAAPEMAAMWSLVLEACKKTSTCAAKGSGSTPYRLGNPNALFYPIYQNSAEYASSFYDVLFGNNALPPDPGFNAGTGYDQVTGIGAPYAKNLITSVLAQVAAS